MPQEFQVRITFTAQVDGDYGHYASATWPCVNIREGQAMVKAAMDQVHGELVELHISPRRTMLDDPIQVTVNALHRAVERDRKARRE